MADPVTLLQEVRAKAALANDLHKRKSTCASFFMTRAFIDCRHGQTECSWASASMNVTLISLVALPWHWQDCKRFAGHSKPEWYMFIPDTHLKVRPAEQALWAAPARASTRHGARYCGRLATATGSCWSRSLKLSTMLGDVGLMLIFKIASTKQMATSGSSS